MSKEATGQMGAKIGSSEYWSAVNKNTLFGSLMGSRTDYQAAIGQLGTKAAAAIEEVYEDLSNLGAKIRYLPSSDRNALAKQVEGLYDICKMSGVSVWHNSECIHGLNLSIMSPWTSSFRDERGIEKAIEFIERSRFSGDAAMKLLQEAARWSISFAAGGDREKQEFLETAAQGNLSSRFLQDVAAEYQNRHTIQRYDGRCGYPVGSKAYMTHLESKVFGTGLPILICAASGNPDYEKLIKDALNSVANQLSRDLDTAIRENDYITDETLDKLKAVVSELDHCGASTGGLIGKAEKLAWFVGGDPTKVRALQKKLNELGIGSHLKEDGVFGAKTVEALNWLHNDLSRGTFPILAWVDPLQGKSTGIKLRGHTVNTDKYGKVSFGAFEDFSSRSKNIKNGTNRGVSVFRFDRDDTIGYHINTVRGEQIDKVYFPDSDKQRQVINSFNHKTVDKHTYKIFKDFNRYAKVIRIGSRVLSITGTLLDLLEILETIHIDKHDADGKIGKLSWSVGASIVGSGSLGLLGAKGGALLGATIGNVFPGPGTAIGGAIGGLVFGIIGSFSGSKLGECVIDITMTE